MRLALAAGRPEDYERMGAALSARELAEWQAFERLEGYSLGDRGAWERTALLASLYAEAHRDPQKRAHSFTMADFLPWAPRARVTSNTFRAWFAGRIKKKGE